MKTLVTDGFSDETPKVVSSEPHNIVYGANLFTDALSQETIDLLVAVGVISFVRAIDHDVAETRIYASKDAGWNYPA